ncbi:MAG: hypothetical protein GYA23_07695 [Methanomicrobiales archaeon]|nr:hypothetical protein [Methanomicrobiales archaeon]
MKRLAVSLFFSLLIVFLVSAGCTNTPAPVPEPVATTVVTTVTPAPTPAPTQNPFPNASALNVASAFGSGTKTGELTVTGFTVRPTYSWVDPSWNSPREQKESSDPLDTQKGYNTKKPGDGNTFLFVYLSVTSTGTEAVWAPSPAQIAVIHGGKSYTYSPLASEKTVVDGELGKQYDFQLGSGGTGGYVQPGKSNTVKGFLIYEIPASFTPDTTFVVANAGAQTQSVWKLA